MSRAQRRDAARAGKFYFRKSVLPPGHNSPTMSTPSTSGSCTPVELNGSAPAKEKKLRNCFPSLPRPPCVEDGPVEDEYEEMTVEEIFVGNVGFTLFLWFPMLTFFLRDLNSLVCLASSWLTSTP